MLRFDLNLVWTILNLLILYFIVWKFLLKPVRKVLDARKAEIDKQYADAQSAQDAAEELKRQYETSMSGIARERTEILNEAHEKAAEDYEQVMADAHTQADRILEDAKMTADAERQKRMHQAQEEIADLVVAATAKIVAARQNEEADRELYNQFLAKTGEKV